ncbi:MAG TPA: GldG family protein [Bryobacteraceae bacterium]|nr:GldG family protein [Bryobacteraceae bacterium]
MNTEWLKARQTKYAAYVTIYVLVILTVVVVANYLANRYNRSYDATANKRFSLSDQTKKVVGDLKQDVTIQYFDRPSGMQAGKDLLDRYANLSPKVHVQYVDLMKQPQLARATNVSREGEAVIEMGAKKEEAKTFDEEGITGAMIRAIKGGARNVCIVSGSGEHRVDDTTADGLSDFQAAVQKDNYQVKTVNLLEKAEVPSDCTVLVIAGPSGDYVQPEVDAIKKYVEGGGRAMFLLDPPLKIGRKEIGDNKGLTDLLASWGVTADKDLLLDENPLSQLVGLDATVPLVTTYESHAIVNDLAGTATGFPISRSLDIKNENHTSVTKLFGTSANSYATYNLASAEIRIDPNKDKKGPFTLAAAGTYDTGKPNNQGRFIVVGDSRWASNSFLRFNGNRNLALNMMNWLSSDEDLISIRPKEQEDRRINLTRGQFLMVRSVSQFLLPLIVIIGGVMVWAKRR